MRLVIIACVIVFGFGLETQAIFIQYETEKVPLDRLFTNVLTKLARDTNNFENTYQLARLHTMAYSAATTLEVQKKDGEPIFESPGLDSGVPRRVAPLTTAQKWHLPREHLTNAIKLYERSIQLLRRSTNAATRRWLVLPLQLGYSWCLDQAGRTNDALQSYRKTLKIAWQKEVEGEFEFKRWLEDSWDQIKAGKFPKSRGRGFIGPGVCFTEETIGYMLNLLDPVKDAEEIAELKTIQSELQKMGRAVTPILVPLNDGLDFSELVAPGGNVEFDLDGSGLGRKWGWLTPRAAWLVFDSTGSGDISSGLQMFGNVTFWIFWQNGYEALRGLDENGDGVLRGGELKGLALWHDVNSDGKSDVGEVRAIAQYGVESLNCNWEMHPAGFPWQREGITFSNGKTRPTYDWIVPGQR